ncbi:hypothetical protein [Microtetraspora glauca]|uniref:PQQ-binding-like beta-propeller repeat protein n=1 Tax=Microtetraspora glauca TaxID=1996 RepID=A0ABV3GNW7_MICGL
MMSAPPEPEWEALWEALCAEAEAVLDADAVRYEQEWLPDALARVAEWPTEVRRCPDRWFTTRRDRVDLLLALGRVDTQVFCARPPIRSDVSWAVATSEGLDIELPGDEDGPCQLALQVARYVRDSLRRLEAEGAAVLHRLAEQRGPRDPFDEGGLHRFEPGATRYDFSDSVAVSATPPRFSLRYDDWAHMVNGWPYGEWWVDFAWGRIVEVRVGPDDCSLDMLPDPPLVAPSLTYSADLPPAWHDAYGTPTLSGDLVLAACGWGRGTAGETGPALVALDAATGVERFRLRIPVARPGATDCQVGTPYPLPDGRILVPVYQWDASLVVYVLAPDGDIVRVDDLGAGREVELCVFGSDLSVKLWQEPIMAGQDSYVASWVYRARAYRMQCRDLETGTLKWEAPERVLARVADAVVTETAPDGDGSDHGAVLVRAIGDGSVLWRLPPRPVHPERSFSMGTMTVRSLNAERSVVLVDRQRRMTAAAAREEGVAELAMASSLDPDEVDFDELERRWDREHPPPGEELAGYAMADGRELWRFEMCGVVTSIASVWASVFAVVVDDAGRPHLECVDVDGAVPCHAPPVDLADVPGLTVGSGPVTGPRADGDLDGDVNRRSREAMRSAPIITYVDTNRLLLATDTELVCVSTADPRNIFWRLPLPDSPRITRPSPLDRRIATASISYDQGRVYVREHATMWTFE